MLYTYSTCPVQYLTGEENAGFDELCVFKMCSNKAQKSYFRFFVQKGLKIGRNKMAADEPTIPELAVLTHYDETTYIHAFLSMFRRCCPLEVHLQYCTCCTVSHIVVLFCQKAVLCTHWLHTFTLLLLPHKYTYA